MRTCVCTFDKMALASRNRSFVWNNFTKISADKAKCDVCSAVLSIKDGSTTNLIGHTKTKHSGVDIDNLNKRVSLPQERKKLYKNYLFFLDLNRFHVNCHSM
jgi:hypothetical protein